MFDYLKKLAKSWTLWVNGTMASVWAFVEFGLPELTASLPILREFVPPDLYGKLFIATAAVNILLRFKTTTALKDK